MKKGFFLNGRITVILDDGTWLVKEISEEQAREIFIKAGTENFTDEDLKILLVPELAQLMKEAEEAKSYNKSVLTALNDLVIDSDFELKENQIYLKGITIPIPGKLLNKMHQDTNLDKWKMFWMWCSLCKNAKVRESFYDYIDQNNIIITKEGFGIGFRRGNMTDNVNAKLNEFVVHEYTRLKKNKKSTNVEVYGKDGQYTTNQPKDESWEFMGMLKNLYLTKEDIVFKSVNTGSDGKPVLYVIGQETRLPDSEIDWNPSNECSRGIHGHNGKYKDSSFGNTRFYYVFNPMDVAACPLQDQAKMRLAAITPIGIMKEDDSIEDFVLTNEIQEVITEMMENHMSRLDLLKVKKFDIGDMPALFKEVDEYNHTKIIETIQHKVSNQLTINRYIKI